MNDVANPAGIDSLPADALALLQRGMAQYRSNPVGAELLFGIARSQAPASLPLYRALVKFYNRECEFGAAYDMAALGMREAARLGNLPPDWRDWALDMLALRRGNTPASVEILEQLRRLDPSDGIGGSEVAALAAGI
jgi:hypothetical protein